MCGGFLCWNTTRLEVADRLTLRYSIVSTVILINHYHHQHALCKLKSTVDNLVCNYVVAPSKQNNGRECCPNATVYSIVCGNIARTVVCRDTSSLIDDLHVSLSRSALAILLVTPAYNMNRRCDVTRRRNAIQIVSCAETKEYKHKFRRDNDYTIY